MLAVSSRPVLVSTAGTSLAHPSGPILTTSTLLKGTPSTQVPRFADRASTARRSLSHRKFQQGRLACEQIERHLPNQQEGKELKPKMSENWFMAEEIQNDINGWGGEGTAKNAFAWHVCKRRVRSNDERTGDESGGCTQLGTQNRTALRIRTAHLLWSCICDRCITKMGGFVGKNSHEQRKGRNRG